MNFETERLSIPLRLVLSIGLGIAIILFGVCYYYLDSGEAKLLGLIGGIETGLIVYLLTFLTLLKPLRELERFRSMGIKALLANRHDQAYYKKLVSNGARRVDVMGASCSRFVQDFLDVESDDKVLVDALSNHTYLKVRLLIPDDENLSSEARSSLPRTLAKVEQAHQRFGDRVELRRFAHKAQHSFVIVDGDIVAGPIFAGDNSRHAPAVHVSAETAFGRKYEDYFDTVWARG